MAGSVGQGELDTKEAFEELKNLTQELLRFIGYAECSGNKCRLPHCWSCFDGEYAGAQGELLDTTRERARVIIKGER